jgi:hypothetical protein
MVPGTGALFAAHTHMAPGIIAGMVIAGDRLITKGRRDVCGLFVGAKPSRATQVHGSPLRQNIGKFASN